jgi:hypothetical protein
MDMRDGSTLRELLLDGEAVLAAPEGFKTVYCPIQGNRFETLRRLRIAGERF